MNWITTIPYGPWMNGLAERIVRLSKIVYPVLHQLKNLIFYCKRAYLQNIQLILQEEISDYIFVFELVQGINAKLCLSGNVDVSVKRIINTFSNKAKTHYINTAKAYFTAKFAFLITREVESFFFNYQLAIKYTSHKDTYNSHHCKYPLTLAFSVNKVYILSYFVLILHVVEHSDLVQSHTHFP